MNTNERKEMSLQPMFANEKKEMSLQPMFRNYLWNGFWEVESRMKGSSVGLCYCNIMYNSL